MQGLFYKKCAIADRLTVNYWRFMPVNDDIKADKSKGYKIHE